MRITRAVWNLVVCAAVGAAWAGVGTPARAQTAAAVAAMLPDVVGFRPGVSIQDGFKQLKAYNPKAMVGFDNVTIPQIGEKPLPYQLTLTDSTSGETLQLGVTLPPNPQVVWKVARQLEVTTPGQEMSRTTLVEALRKKYGREDHASLPNGGGDMVWLFDENGRRATENKPPDSPCTAAPVLSNTNGLGMAPLNTAAKTYPPSTGWERCKSLVFVKAFMQRRSGNDDSINVLVVTVGDNGLASRAQNTTAAYIAGTDQKQQSQELDKQRQRAAPKL
ncbi:MAG TPA: hypothetical protein VHH11_02590 [Gammaproteobacteria bacterium]|jgi:hypothetical protein|nr:hypothetical protein [Gammaproteobacteria bacterium]